MLCPTIMDVDNGVGQNLPIIHPTGKFASCWFSFLSTYLESHDPSKNGAMTQNYGVRDPFFKGHGDSR